MEPTWPAKKSNSEIGINDSIIYDKWSTQIDHNSDEDTEHQLAFNLSEFSRSTYDDEEIDFYEANREKWLDQKIETEIQFWLNFLHDFSWYYQYDEHSRRNGVPIQMLESFLAPAQKIHK